jgi:hypothetical protein
VAREARVLMAFGMGINEREVMRLESRKCHRVVNLKHSLEDYYFSRDPNVFAMVGL